MRYDTCCFVATGSFSGSAARLHLLLCCTCALPTLTVVATLLKKRSRRSSFVMVATTYLRCCFIVAANMRSKVDSQSLPNRSSEDSKTTPEKSKIDPRKVQNRPKIALGGSRSAQKRPRDFQDLQNESKMDPSWQQHGHKGL